MKEQMRILITGGAGYIGCVLAERLLKSGHRVLVLDNFMHGQDLALAHLCHRDDFEVRRGDARDDDTIRALVSQVDAVIPLAAIVGAPACDADRWAAAETIVGGAETILRHIGRDQLLVVPTTNSGYGIGEPGVACTEESPLRPISLYGRLKIEAESMYLEQHQNAVSLRLATVFGMSPRMRLDLLVNDFVHRAARDRSIVLFEGHFRRNYVHVRDVAGAFVVALHRMEQMRGKPYNVGLPDCFTKAELCRRIGKFVHGLQVTEAPVGRDPDQRDYEVSSERIREEGWAPAWSIEHGILELLKGLRMIRNERHGNV